MANSPHAPSTPQTATFIIDLAIGIRQRPHFSALGGKGGKPTYVACWYIKDKKVKIVEIYYVGTHEKAPY